MVKYCGTCGNSYTSEICGKCMAENMSMWTPAEREGGAHGGCVNDADINGMCSEVFDRLLNEQLERSRDVLCTKASEYATGDRLHNFRVAAKLRGCSLEQAVAGMMAKHTVSVYDMCESGRVYPMELWTEKITDSINYLLLLNAVVREGQPR